MEVERANVRHNVTDLVGVPAFLERAVESKMTLFI